MRACVGNPRHLQSRFSWVQPLGPTPRRPVSSPVWSFAHQTWSCGWLRCLRAILLEMPLLSTVITSSSLFTLVPLGIFSLRLFQSKSYSHLGASVFCEWVSEWSRSVWLFVTPWTVAHQAPLSMGFSRWEYWSGSPFPSPGDLPNPGIEPRSPTLQADALTSEPPGKPFLSFVGSFIFLFSFVYFLP